MDTNWSQLVSSDDLFNERKQRDPNSFALELSLSISQPSNGSTDRIICAELLNKLLTDDPDLYTWHNLPVSTRSTVKEMLLDRLMHEESRSVALELSDTVVKLAPSIISGNNDSNTWPELLPRLYQCITTNSSSHNYTEVSAFRIFEHLADKIGETILSSRLKDSFHCVLRNTLYDNTLNLDMRIAALSAATNFIICVKSSNEKERFQYLLPGMMMTLTDTVSNTHGDLFFQKELPLKCLIKLAKHDPRFLRMQLVDVVSTVLDIVEAECLEEKVRSEGVEFLLTLVEAKEKAPGMMKKLPLFVGKCFAMLLNLFVLDIKDDPTWHSAETLHDEAGITSTFRVGEEGLKRFSCALGSKSVAHEAKEQLSAYLASPEWEKRHAALWALTCIAKGYSEVITKNLEQVMSMVLKCFQDPLPRVRSVACRAIAVFFEDFGPHLLERYHNQVYHALSVVLDDGHPRVQAYATLALSQFCCSKNPEAFIMPNIDGIVNKLLVLLQNEKQMVQQAALRSFAFTAESVKEHFRTYYDTVMPHLKDVIRNADLKSDLSLRARAIECISIVGFAVGKEKFREDAKQIIEMLMPLQGLEEEIDDSTTWEILWSSIRICECMGNELLPYLMEVIPLLIQCAKWHVSKRIKKAIFRDKTLWVIHDYHLKIKVAHACDMLGWCASILKEDFFPWIPEVVSVLVPLLKFHSNNYVRKYAVMAMPSMLRCAILAVEKGIHQSGSEAYFTELSDNIIKALVEALHKEQVGDLCAIMLQVLQECLQICGSLLYEGLVRIIVDEVMHVITDSSNRKQELNERTKFEDFDDEEAELLLKDERWLEVIVFIRVCCILETLTGAFKTAFLPFLDELSSYLSPMLKKEKTTSSERSVAICIFVNPVVLCPEAAGKYYKIYFPLILDLSDDEDPHVRKNALYGLRLWAKNGRSSFKDFLGEALSRINKVIMHSKALEPENEIAYNYAVSALGTICQFHGEQIDLAQVFPVWLNCLPIKADFVEAKLVHDLFCLMDERSQKDFFDPNNQYIPNIVAVFVEVLCSKNDLVYEETENHIINVLRHLQQTIPATLLSELSYLLPQHAMELKSILSLNDDDAN